MRSPLLLTLLPALTLLVGCAELTELRDRADIQEREIARLRTELNQWRTAYHDLLAQREEELAERNDRIESLQSEVTRLTTRQSESERRLETELGQARDDLRTARADLASRQAEANTLRGQMAGLERRLDEAEADRDALLSQIEEIESTLSEVGEEAVAAQEGEQQAQSALASQRERLQSAIEDRDQMITDLRNRLLALQEAPAAGAAFTDAELDRIANYLGDTLDDDGPEPRIARDPRRGVIVTFASGDLFESGSTVVADSARQTLRALAVALAQLPETSIEVVGHTDNEPVRNLPFRDNWQLSASRAENVLRVMLSDGQLPPERCRFGAGGEAHPVESNATLAGRQANRRVEIIVVPSP